MPDDLSIPRMPRKQIELWDITSTSGNFRPYQIQTANIHFKKNNQYQQITIIYGKIPKHKTKTHTNRTTMFDVKLS